MSKILVDSLGHFLATSLHFWVGSSARPRIFPWCHEDTCTESSLFSFLKNSA